MNPYTRKGRAAALATVMYESLLGHAGRKRLVARRCDYDELYGLLAHTVEYPEDKSWVIFHMRPEARFSDGTPVTAHDVAFSTTCCWTRGCRAMPRRCASAYPKAEVIDDHTIKFRFADGISRRSLIDQVGTVPVFSKKWYEETGARLDESRLEVSPGSGPYVIDKVEVNRRVVYKRNPDYWGWDLPINRGRHNFDEIRLEYFADATPPSRPSRRARSPIAANPTPRNGPVSMSFRRSKPRPSSNARNCPTACPADMTGIVFNLGSEVLQDKRVRRPSRYAFNFEWTNARCITAFTNSSGPSRTGRISRPRACPRATSWHSSSHWAIVVPPEVLTEAPWVPHTLRPRSLLSRGNMRKAIRLFWAMRAGWKW